MHLIVTTYKVTFHYVISEPNCFDKVLVPYYFGEITAVIMVVTCNLLARNSTYRCNGSYKDL